MTSKPPPRPISYPNHITDPHTVDKMREMIDHQNSLKTVVDQNLASVQAQADEQAGIIRTLPTVTNVNNLISAATGTNGVITQAVIDLLKTRYNLTPSASAAALRAAKIPQRMLSGVRTAAPMGLGPSDAGLFFYVTDYAHLAIWDGWAYQISDPGGYFVDSDLQLGAGFALCDGSTTTYLLNDTPNLDIAGVELPRHHSLRRRHRRYFRR